MDLLAEYVAELRAVSELILAGVCILFCLRYRAARSEALVLCQAGRSFLRGLPVTAVSKIKSVEGRSLIRLLQMSATQSKREKFSQLTNVEIDVKEYGDLEQLGEALITAISNQAVIRPKAARIFHKKDGKLLLLSQKGLVSGRFGRIIYDHLNEKLLENGSSDSSDAGGPLQAFGICQHFFSKFLLPDHENDELVLWLGFDEFHSSGFKDHQIAFESLVRNLNVVISQFKKIASLEKEIGDEREAFLGISHDLKAPSITALYLIRELQNRLGEPESNQSVYSDLEILMFEQLSLIHDYLDIEKERFSSISPMIQTFDVQRLIQEISDSPLVRCDRNRPHFGILISTQAQVSFDRNHLKRIILNLLSNSFKYCPNGKVTLGVSPVGNREIRLYVSDTGSGIPPELSKKLFSKFQRLDAPVDISGNGIGLAASQLLAERNGSKLQYEFRPEVGSIFSLTIARSEESENAKPELREGPRNGARTVLVVEDDEATCRLYRRILNSKGYDVESHSSIKTALSSLLFGYQFAALVTDFKLHDGDSFTLLKEISQKGLSLPTLIISGMTDWSGYHSQMREVMERVFLVRFLEKPIERIEFETAFSELVEEQNSEVPELSLRS